MVHAQVRAIGFFLKLTVKWNISLVQLHVSCPRVQKYRESSKYSTHFVGTGCRSPQGGKTIAQMSQKSVTWPADGARDPCARLRPVMFATAIGEWRVGGVIFQTWKTSFGIQGNRNGGQFRVPCIPSFRKNFLNFGGFPGTCLSSTPLSPPLPPPLPAWISLLIIIIVAMCSYCGDLWNRFSVLKFNCVKLAYNNV